MPPGLGFKSGVGWRAAAELPPSVVYLFIFWFLPVKLTVLNNVSLSSDRGHLDSIRTELETSKIRIFISLTG